MSLSIKRPWNDAPHRFRIFLFPKLNDRAPRIIQGGLREDVHSSWFTRPPARIYQKARPPFARRGLSSSSSSSSSSWSSSSFLRTVENLAQWGSHAIRDRGSYTCPRETRLHTEMFRQTAFGIALLRTLIFLGSVGWGVRYNRVDGQSVETIPFEKFHSRPFYKYRRYLRWRYRRLVINSGRYGV